MRILITGAAGFIGSALCLKLLKRGNKIIGLDNHNDYYNPKLKSDRLKLCKKYVNYTHFKIDIANKNKILKVFDKNKPSIVINMAAQAGVRYSLKNPTAYIDSNLVGFGNILEACRINNIKHLIYASSSSVYGANTLMPYSVEHNVNHPISLYAATKKANELMAHSYSHLYKLPTTGLRFFTVYGPWDRPDMALQKFAQAIISNKYINIFNNGKHQRDFTYIDDIVDGVIKVLDLPAKPNLKWKSNNPDPSTSNAPWRIYNIGSNNPVSLIDYISVLEKALGKKAKKKFISIQPGDIPKTWAKIDNLIDQFNYDPKTTIEEGVTKFANWFKYYYKV